MTEPFQEAYHLKTHLKRKDEEVPLTCCERQITFAAAVVAAADAAELVDVFVLAISDADE